MQGQGSPIYVFMLVTAHDILDFKMSAWQKSAPHEGTLCYLGFYVFNLMTWQPKFIGGVSLLLSQNALQWRWRW